MNVNSNEGKLNTKIIRHYRIFKELDYNASQYFNIGFIFKKYIFSNLES